jgi:hypothetical protein
MCRVQDAFKMLVIVALLSMMVLCGLRALLFIPRVQAAWEELGAFAQLTLGPNA